MQCYKKFLVIQTISDKNMQLTHDLEITEFDESCQ